jgi:2,3-bisphosphoglycerate-dependent phosphoglycerate mutase
MTVKAKLALLRHGETEYNNKHLMTGQADIPLTENGKEQAREAGRLLTAHGHKADAVFSSSLQRAFNTASLLLEHSEEIHIHLKNTDGTWNIGVRHEIKETNTGDFTGRNYKDDPEIRNHIRDFDNPFPNGESPRDVVSRIQRFFDAEVRPLLERGENVLIVAHAGVLRAFDILLGIEADEALHKGKRPIENAAPEIYEYEDGVLTRHYPLQKPGFNGAPSKP